MSLFFKQKQLPALVIRHGENPMTMAWITRQLHHRYENNQHVHYLLELLREKDKAFMAIINQANQALSEHRATIKNHNLAHQAEFRTKESKIKNEIRDLEHFRTDFYKTIATTIQNPQLFQKAKDYFKDSEYYSRVGGKHGERSFTTYDDLSEKAAEIGLLFMLVGAGLLGASTAVPAFLPVGIALVAVSAVFLAPALFYFFVETLPNIISTWYEEKKLFDTLELVVKSPVEAAQSDDDLDEQNMVNPDQPFAFQR